MKYELFIERYGLEFILSNLNILFKFNQKNDLFFGNLIVDYKDRILFLGSNGTTNSLKNGNKINKYTIFELASVSKQFTSYASLIALEKLGISIDCDF
ncbi:hypothetical protein DLM75_23180 [Leptospira stimsonii]|uniref:Beta-lactamase-related domain-containing protein n=1 Tax=Leptospira stimsonii TaxID=2202203 RepID=A0A396YTU6_9LEPT|nr:hypothetical protein DLM75_23180 [Leptospira stimsonii]